MEVTQDTHTYSKDKDNKMRGGGKGLQCQFNVMHAHGVVLIHDLQHRCTFIIIK